MVESLGDRTRLEASRGAVGGSADGDRVASAVGVALNIAQGPAEGQGQLVWKQRQRAVRPVTHIRPEVMG